LVENFRPGVADRLGVGYADIRALAPAAVYCSISAFGDAPQARALPGYDLLVQAVGGMMSVTGTQESGPTKAGVAVVDVLAGLHASSGVLAALWHAERTGQGQHVQVSLLGTALASLVNQSSAYLLTGQVPQRMGNAHPSLAPYETFRCGDGEIVLAVGNDRQFRDLAVALSAPELAADQRFATNTQRVSHRRELTAALEQAMSRHAVDDLVARLLAAGVPAGAVNDLAGAFEQAQELGLEPVAEVGDAERSVRTTASPLRMSATPVTYRTPPPRLPET
jgi:crotonobetainyl-CoA:carnitine CoA-transferase CaiB-like acyl-CoA transferase